MNLIKHIEIAYFRSIYKVRLDDLSGTNIIFGRNDSGKSNIIRALNLFFNNETNPDLDFDFNRDFCHARSAEADPTRNIRKFVYVKIWFSTPPNWQASLGKEFWVKKQWSTTRELDPNIESSIPERRLQQYLTRFLNRVRFHYIPAIKDREIFESLLEEIYRVVASQKAFSDSLLDFTTALKDRTVDLTEGLLDGLGINSVISPPDDLSDLFRSLDFETSIDNGDSYNLTLQRGDGIQVRHIPAILAFLSDRSSEDYHVWGFEEPENSLELANAIEEAKIFCQYGEDPNKQVFITSHSPAFFALTDGNVSRYFVSRTEEHSGRHASSIRNIPAAEENAPSELMGETPHLPIISSYLRQADAQIRILQALGDNLAKELQQRNTSLVFVEGVSDSIIIGAAWDQYFGVDRPFEFECAAGTTKMQGLSADGQLIDRLAPGRKIFVIVDNDMAGRGLYKNGRLDGGGKWVKHNSNGVYWCRLPYGDGFRKCMSKLKIPKSHWPGSLENLFSSEIREEAELEGKYALSPLPHDELLNSQRYPLVLPYLPPNEVPEKYYVLRTDESAKLSFANWVKDRALKDVSVLSPLQSVVEGIYRQLIGPLPTTGDNCVDVSANEPGNEAAVT